ncbi:MAG TPA: SDR family NAD(P)-dependent oxidoreductase [Kofleriaceae bacterium]|nr:SDR family NAD(P)-dependent oxidoreductase [Kofleriaceae bacterium]
MKQLEGKVAVVTGAASGIGLAMARRFATEKMKLVLLDIEEGALAAVEKELRASGTTVLAIRTDVSRSAELEAAAARAHDQLGTVHVICNNAGVGGVGGPMWKLSEADWQWTLSVNLWSVIHGVRLFLGPLLDSGEEGHVVNTASMAGLTSVPFMGPYTATKHAVVAISEVLAKELELVGAKVGVSVLCPGFVRTQISSSERNRPTELGPQPSAEAGASTTIAQAVQQLVSAGQAPEGIAEAVVNAIREGHFYVLTHPEMKPAIGHRMNDILEERAPGIDPLFRQLFSR